MNAVNQFGHRHLSQKIHRVEFDINVLLGEMIHQNLMSKIEMSTYHSMLSLFDVRFHH